MMTLSARRNSSFACSRYSLIFSFPSGFRSDLPNSNNAASPNVMTLTASGIRLTVAAAVRDPPSPVAVIVYCVVIAGQTCLEPVGATSPTPWSIEALEAPVEDQVRVAH